MGRRSPAKHKKPRQSFWPLLAPRTPCPPTVAVRVVARDIGSGELGTHHGGCFGGTERRVWVGFWSSAKNRMPPSLPEAQLDRRWSRGAWYGPEPRPINNYIRR